MVHHFQILGRLLHAEILDQTGVAAGRQLLHLSRLGREVGILILVYGVVDVLLSAEGILHDFMLLQLVLDGLHAFLFRELGGFVLFKHHGVDVAVGLAPAVAARAGDQLVIACLWIELVVHLDILRHHRHVCLFLSGLIRR